MLAALTGLGRLSYSEWQAHAVAAGAVLVVLICFVGVIRIGIGNSSLRGALLQTAILAVCMAAHVAFLAKRGGGLDTVIKAIIGYSVWLGVCIYISLNQDRRITDGGAWEE